MKILILGAGISGHTAALTLRRKLGSEHEVVVVSPNKNWNWIPSNIWVGTGHMAPQDVTFELAPIYKKQKITHYQAKATDIFPEGSADSARPYVLAESTHASNVGEKIKIDYDFLINATGPRLNFNATPGLGPTGFTQSVCTFDHAHESAKELDRLTEEMKKGAKKTFVIGTGHGTCTCQGAAFEYIFNLEFSLRQRGVREQARIVFITNEADLGDFGVGGMTLKMGGFTSPGKVFAESLFAEKGIEWITGAHVHQVEKGFIHYETLDGEKSTVEFDFSMLIPPFAGQPLKAFSKTGEDITSILFAPSGFMKVDADYTAKPYEEWKPEDWPESYQTKYKNVFAIGIAFAPPHQISQPRKSKNGTVIAPAPPRTGMPSAIMGRAVAKSIAHMIATNTTTPKYGASLASIGAACVASVGASIFDGAAVSMTMYPIVPDFKKYPDGGRHLSFTTGELGLAGHWIKLLLHYAFLYKAKAYPLWWIIPE
jgi:sulfide:quinone oxidoreductase